MTMKVGCLLCLCMFYLSTGVSLAAPATPPVSMQPHTNTATFGRFGTVRLFQPRGVISSVTILASGDGRWDDPLMQTMAQLLVQAGSAVIGIDTVAYLQAADVATDQCVYMDSDFEELAHSMEKTLGMPRYLPPVLAGYSSGAALVYAVLAQASRGVFQGGMSIGFCSELNLQAALCSPRGTLSKPPRQGQPRVSVLLPVHELSANWVVLQGEQDSYCSVATVRQFSSQVTAAELHSLPGVNHFFEKPRDWRDAFLNAHRGLLSSIAGLPPEVSDLPVTVVPSTRAGDELAILLTGDGGWAELDQEMAHDLSAAGVSVVALSSLQYFWQARTPQQAAGDLSRLINHYAQVWQRPRVRLLGYSFGADVLPAIINALPGGDRARIVSVGLLSLLPRTSFEIHVAGWLGQVVGEQPVRPEVEKLAVAGIPVTCVHGRDDEESLCRELPASVAQVVALPGGHNCNDDHAAIVRAWLTARNALTMEPTGARPADDKVHSGKTTRL
ncbi:MAG: AcvB/VirJ family lysyl-phosphatidylglycerol hydrolase [Steroidobacteraceae bacterium]